MAEKSKVRSFVQAKDPEGPQEINRRHFLAAQARVATPITHLSHNTLRPTSKSSREQNQITSDVRFKKSRDAWPKDQQLSQTQDHKASGFDTDLDDYDDTITNLYHDTDIEDSQPQTETHPYQYYESEQVQEDQGVYQEAEVPTRQGGPQQSEREPAEQYIPQASPQYERFRSEDRDEEESEDDEGSNDGPEDDDPTLDSSRFSTAAQLLTGIDAIEYAEFQRSRAGVDSSPSISRSAAVSHTLPVRDRSLQRQTPQEFPQRAKENTQEAQMLQSSLDDEQRIQVYTSTASTSNLIVEGLSNSSEQHVSEGFREPVHKHSLDLDYSDAELSNMTFDRLKNEPFDQDPRATAGVLPDNLTDASLPDKLVYITSSKGLLKQVEQQKAFFSSLDIGQYENCGDLIVDRFAAIMTKFKDARQEKRKIAKEFEAEVAKREECVRARKAAIETDMERLRSAGKELVKRRAI